VSSVDADAVAFASMASVRTKHDDHRLIASTMRFHQVWRSSAHLDATENDTVQLSGRAWRGMHRSIHVQRWDSEKRSSIG